MAYFHVYGDDGSDQEKGGVEEGGDEGDEVDEVDEGEDEEYGDN